MLGGQLAGAPFLCVVPNLTHQGLPCAVFENVVMTSPARQRGVATALLRRLIRIARQAGCSKVQSAIVLMPATP
jgi:GNAT superfamily N-acetyltransferase